MVSSPALSGWRARLGTFDVLALTASLWFLSKFLRYALPPLFPTFSRIYGVSNTELGVVFSALMVGYALMQFPSGALADRIGTVGVITAGAVVAAGASLLLFFATGYAFLVVAMLLIGVGTGSHKTVAITLLSLVYPEQTGRALGTMDTVGELGGVLAPAIVVAVLSAAVGWESIFLGVAVAGLVLAWAFKVRVGDRIPDGSGSDADDDADATATHPREYLVAFSEPLLVAFTAVCVLFAFALNGLTAFLPLYLASAGGLDTDAAGLLYSAFFAIAVVQPATGELADRFGSLRVLVVTLAAAAAGLALLVVVDGWVALAAAVVLLGAGMHGTRPGRDAYLVDVIPDDVAGGTLGVVRTVMIIIGSVAPAVVGYLSDVATFRLAFGLLAVALAVGVALVAAIALVDR